MYRSQSVNKRWEKIWSEEIRVCTYTIVITVLIAVLFYRSIWACILAPIFYYIIRNKERKSKKEQQDKKLLEQFINGIRILNTSLQAGVAMENAWVEVEKEIKHLYGEEDFFYQKMREINHAVTLNNPIEKQFLKFAQDTGLEDIIQFAELFEYGKRSGGNWKKIIDSTVQRLNEKFETEKQIEVLVAEKQMEQRVMNIIPLGILAFLQFFSWDYMSVLYHNLLGVICMSIVLAGYCCSIFLAEKILQIKV